MNVKPLFKALRWAVIVGLALLWLAMFVRPLFAAADQCAPRADVIEQLKARYGERLLFFGSLTGEVMFELWGKEGGSWSLLFTQSDGTTCLVGAGHNLRAAPKGDPA